MGVSTIVNLGGNADVLVQANSAAAPTSGATFCSLAAPPAGVYRLDIIYCVTGAVETLPLNVRLKLNNATFTTYPSGAGIGAVYTVQLPRITLDGTNVVALLANAAAAASTVYAGQITATKLQ